MCMPESRSTVVWMNSFVFFGTIMTHSFEISTLISPGKKKSLIHDQRCLNLWQTHYQDTLMHKHTKVWHLTLSTHPTQPQGFCNPFPPPLEHDFWFIPPLLPFLIMWVCSDLVLLFNHLVDSWRNIKCFFFCIWFKHFSIEFYVTQIDHLNILHGQILTCCTPCVWLLQWRST